MAGLTIAWIADRFLRSRAHLTSTSRWLPVACVAAAASPDLDILFGSHRTYSHSIGATALAGLLTWLVLEGLRAQGSGLRVKAGIVAVIVATAYFTHIALDWLGKDSATPLGLMALWPISSSFYMSGLDLFSEISRRYWRPSEFIVGNFRSLAWEIVILAPVAAVAYWIRFKMNVQRREREEQS